MSIELNNTIILDEKEDYQQIGNSRIGGKPDMPKNMNYPLFSNGLYEFILQLNLNENPVQGLPDKGILSIFYGSLDNNEAIGYYFENLNDLELKEIPTSNKFAGVTDFHEHIPYKIKVRPRSIIPREKLPEYNDSQFTEEENINHWQIDFLRENSFLLYEGLDDKNEMYFTTNGFDLISYGIRINEKNNSLIYQGQNANMEYKGIEDLISCQITKFYENRRFPKKATREEWIAQLEAFEREKDTHIERFKDYTCLLSLASLNETRMTWGDLHKLEFYGYKSDFSKGIFNEINSTMP